MPDGSTDSPENRRNESSEILFNPRSIAIVTGTFYPEWYAGDTKKPLSADKVRGDLALESFKSAQNQNFQLSIIDGGSSDAFKSALERNGISFAIQKERSGQGPARRQGLEEVGVSQDVKVICEIEPEKVSIVSDCMKAASLPILKGEADIVVPSRDAESFLTYPKYQADKEQNANKLYNRILHSRGLLKENDLDLDFWFGPRFFANRPEITKLFKGTYQYRKGTTALDKKVNLDMYSNPLFFPIAEALHKGYRVKSVTVPYRHPKIQKEFEEKQTDFDNKRDTQRRTIITELVNFIRYLENSPKTHISKS